MLRFVHFWVFKHQIQTMYMWLVSFIDNRSSLWVILVFNRIRIRYINIYTPSQLLRPEDTRKSQDHGKIHKCSDNHTVTVLTDSQEPGYTNTDIFFKLKSYYSDLLDRLRYKLWRARCDECALYTSRTIQLIQTWLEWVEIKRLKVKPIKSGRHQRWSTGSNDNSLPQWERL